MAFKNLKISKTKPIGTVLLLLLLLRVEDDVVVGVELKLRWDVDRKNSKYNTS